MRYGGPAARGDRARPATRATMLDLRWTHVSSG